VAATAAAAKGDGRTRALWLLLVMLPLAKLLLCMPREDRVTLLEAAATPRRLLLWLLDCCRTLPLLLLCPDAAGGLPPAAALLPIEPDGAAMALAMLLHRA
jgi:hypothetical protein